MKAKSSKRNNFFGVAIGMAALPTAAIAQEAAGGVDSFLILGLIPFIPAALLMLTGFTRILISMSLVRHALGLTTTPSNQIIIGLSLILTFVAMEPTMSKIESAAWTPWRTGKTTAFEALQAATPPLKDFMANQIRPGTLEVMYPDQKIDIKTAPLPKLAGAFVISEIRTGFEIGLLIFIPFLLVDVLVASILMSLGMMMLSPTMISLPLKVLLFVMVDGWVLIAGGLIGSFK